MYAKGFGVSQDYGEAVKWWRLAAAQGNARAQRNLGIAYENGRGVAQDHREAAKWFRLADKQKIGLVGIGEVGPETNLVRVKIW